MYQDLNKLIEENPKIIDDLIESCGKIRAGYRNDLANMLIETTPQEINELINLISMVKNE